MKRALFVFAVAALASAVTFAQSGGKSQTGLQGVWQVTEITTTGTDASTNKSPQPGLYIFTGKHYSMMRVNGDKPRPLLPKDQTKLTAPELIELYDAVYATGYTSQSGTYEITGTLVRLRPTVATNPGIMVPTYSTVYDYKVDGTTLTLVSTSQGKPSKNPTTWKLSRVE
jgi:hypothetical protein